MEPSTKAIVYERIFDAPREMVWKAWTDPEMIKKWWGPKGFSAPEAKIDLRVGGTYLFCMRGKPAPEAPEQDFWSGGTYKEIVPMEKLVVTDYFSDKDGNKTEPAAFGLSPDFPKESDITVTFEDVDGSTKLTIRYTSPITDTEYEAMKKSGMDEGWNSSLDKLAEALR